VKNDDDYIPVSFLTQIADALELHNKILADHRKFIEQLIQENTELKKRLAKLETADSSDEKFVADISTRLAAISSAVKAKS